MPVKKNSGRQEVIRAYVDIAYSDLVSGAAAEAIDLPVGAQVVDGEIVRDTAFNSSVGANGVVYSVAAVFLIAIAAFSGDRVWEYPLRAYIMLLTFRDNMR